MELPVWSVHITTNIFWVWNPAYVSYDDTTLCDKVCLCHKW
jgi:hypothetical protein